MTTNIRYAEYSDRIRVLRLLKDAAENFGMNLGGGHLFNFKLDAVYGIKLFCEHLSNPDKAAIVLEVDNVIQGILLVASGIHPFGNIKVSKEVVWYVHPDHRGVNAIRMLKLYDSWALSKGVRFPGIGHMITEGASFDIGKFYAKLGYRPVEISYIKDLGEPE